jgi:hypothetical protein
MKYCSEVLREILRRIYGAVKIDGVWRRCYNKQLFSLFNDVDIIKRIKINWLRRAEHVIWLRRENEEIIKILMILKPEGKTKNVNQERDGWMVWRRIWRT